MAELRVQKKDGRPEAFDRSKIKDGLLKSGASSEQAENITSQVESWARTIAVNDVVKTIDIRTKVLELLRQVNPTAAATFEAYRKPA